MSSKEHQRTFTAPLLFSMLATISLAASSISIAQESSTDDADEQVSQPNYERGDGERKYHKRRHYKRMAKLMLKRLDTNKDGKVDLNEYLQNSEQRFQTMDINSDGYVTPEEARESHKLMREKFKKMHEEAKQLDADESNGDS